MKAGGERGIQTAPGSHTKLRTQKGVWEVEGKTPAGQDARGKSAAMGQPAVCRGSPVTLADSDLGRHLRLCAKRSVKKPLEIRRADNPWNSDRSWNRLCFHQPVWKDPWGIWKNPPKDIALVVQVN